MSEVKKAQESMFGYEVVRNVNLQTIELPNPHLIRLLTGRKKEKGLQLLAQMEEEVTKVVIAFESQSSTRAISESLLDSTIAFVVSLIKSELREEILRSPHELKKAALSGYQLGQLDRIRIGETPPVALASHRKALSKICEKYFSEEGREQTPTEMVCIEITKSSFYESRRIKL